MCIRDSACCFGAGGVSRFTGTSGRSALLGRLSLFVLCCQYGYLQNLCNRRKPTQPCRFGKQGVSGGYAFDVYTVARAGIFLPIFRQLVTKKQGLGGQKPRGHRGLPILRLHLPIYLVPEVQNSSQNVTASPLGSVPKHLCTAAKSKERLYFIVHVAQISVKSIQLGVGLLG